MSLELIQRKTLMTLSDKELSKLQRSLDKYINTPEEKSARELNKLINEERARRSDYGF